MSEHDPRERAYSRTLEESARERHIAAALARRSRRPIEPGDLCVLPATAAYPVEWALVERGLDDPGQLLAVPADTFPPAGTGDVEIPESDPAGPLRLRCRHALWVDEKALGQACRTGVLAARWLREAGARHEALAAGPLPPASLAEEMEADPEYRDWERDVLAPARAALERESAGAAAGPRRIAGPRPWRSFPAQMAAVFLLAAVGLGVWNARLRDQLAEPILSEAVQLPTGQRGPGDLTVEVAGEATHVVLLLLVEKPVMNGRVEIRDRDERQIWRSEPITAEGLDLYFTVPRLILPDGSYQILLVGADGRTIHSWPIDVETIKPQP